MLVQVKKVLASKAVKDDWNDSSVFIGNRSYNHADGPFELENKKAEALIKLGVVDAVIQMPKAAAERAVAPKLEAQRR